MRIKKNPFSIITTTEAFENVLIIPNTEENMNIVILIPKDGHQINNENMLSIIRKTLTVSNFT